MVLSQCRLELWPVKGASSQLLVVFNLRYVSFFLS